MHWPVLSFCWLSASCSTAGHPPPWSAFFTWLPGHTLSPGFPSVTSNYKYQSCPGHHPWMLFLSTKTHSLGDLGQFYGIYHLSPTEWQIPNLVSSTFKIQSNHFSSPPILPPSSLTLWNYCNNYLISLPSPLLLPYNCCFTQQAE